MSGRIDLPEESQLEVWETTTAATSWVWVYDRRNDKYTKQRVGGVGGGSKRLTISMGDRRYNQEMVIEEMRGSDIFSNGAMLRLSGPELTEDDEHLSDLSNHKTNADLLEYFAITDDAIFSEAIEDITSETVIRRLHSLARKSALSWQLTKLDELIEDRYRVGGSSRVVAEILADEAANNQGGSLRVG